MFRRAIAPFKGIAPELMGHVAIPLRWKEFLFHRGCSFNLKSILEAGRIAGGKDRKEGRQTVFFTPVDHSRDKAEDDFNNDSSRPRKVHFNCKWKPHQDAVYWIHLARAQEKGLQFWQTRSRGMIVHDSVSRLHRKSLIPEKETKLRITDSRRGPLRR